MIRFALPCQLAVLLLASLPGCEPDHNPGPQGDSHTNWLRSCEDDGDCGTLSCICGACTTTCTSNAMCADVPGTSCVSASEPGVVSLCDGRSPLVSGLCMATCPDGGCSGGQVCVSGVCQPQGGPDAEVSVDISSPGQRLMGFGASIGYAEDDIAQFGRAEALSEAMFAGLGLDVLRFRNRYGEVSDASLRQATNIVASAKQSLGRSPLVLLGAWSPPSYLKQNASTFCSGNASTCTLTKNSAGEFDYDGLATYWRSSLEAYSQAGFSPDYVGIQNNPDWTPSSGVFEACRFLPTEGRAQVLVDGASVSISYPGYKQAFAAVRAALEGLDSQPLFLAPDLSGVAGADEYLSALDPGSVDAVAHHLYGTNPKNLDLASLEALSSLGGTMGVPLFQTEMQAGGFDTALLIHHALVEGGASMYLQTALVGALSGPAANPTALIGMDEDNFVLQDPYFAMSHFARFTDPGWVRVSASVTSTAVLASAWLAPNQDALTIVLINADDEAQTVAVDPGLQAFGTANLYRSVFGAAEHFANLGSWQVDANIPLPPRSVATLVLQQ